MQHHLSPRSQAFLDRIDAWSDAGPLRSVAVRVGVTVLGPLVVLAGLAMTVLPGPGLVVMVLGLALLALEYQWARSVLGGVGGVVTWARELVLPRGASPRRRAFGLAVVGAGVVATTLLTATISTYVGAQAFA
ncbi:PGPGW domain-containing protein [Nocardioides mangrovi]|uniref:PGPGW domain-containing protein n=1 Tax=Nocardioides mangrovi TaxID=2874580 RepID=A0ABS7UIM7_9ACTN|nr:PGPGW domain-containing protein [Nocardioides mangrovi]MBZ5740488.1 PGPGW domain-containing protein [Nocardioides mangrovi]